MSLSHLRAIHACGAHLCEALEAGALDEAATLTLEREALVAELHAAPRPSPLPAAWVEVGEALTSQHRALTALLETRERELTDAMAGLTHRRKAHASYDEPPLRSGRLHPTHG